MRLRHECMGSLTMLHLLCYMACQRQAAAQSVITTARALHQGCPLSPPRRP